MKDKKGINPIYFRQFLERKIMAFSVQTEL